MTWQRRWLILSRERWLRVLSALREFGVDFEAHPLELLVREPLEEHSNAQRRLFHAVCADAGPHFGMTPGEFKAAVKAEYFGDDWRAHSTEDLDHAEYGQLIETAYRLAAEHGFFIPDRRRGF